MRAREQWIWLPKEHYPENQECSFSKSAEGENYTVASFSGNYRFGKEIEKIKLRFSGDTFFRLFCNGEFLATGPAATGGDFSFRPVPYAEHYATEKVITSRDVSGLKQGDVTFFALVRMMPVLLYEQSKGRGGFFLQGEVFFADGCKTYIQTDESWLARKENAYQAPNVYDETVAADEETAAQRVQNIWHTQTSPIPSCAETEVFPLLGGKIVLEPKEKRLVELEFDRVYAGYLFVKTNAPISIEGEVYEVARQMSHVTVRMAAKGVYRGIDFYSLDRIKVTVVNDGDKETELEISLLATCYPVEVQAKTITSDEKLNSVLDVCAHSLRYCRQSLHLDSPLHCEPLACTGDYYVETLMTAFTFGDLRLSAFDVRRTAELLRYQKGKMFHTTYSLIWVLMLWDVYRYTGETELLRDCEEALTILLERFAGYPKENGIVETPDYMFVDWLIPDGINLHHPPKALGQTCMNMFYFGALQTAEKIYATLGLDGMAKKCERAYSELREGIVKNLWDGERGLFFEGLNTPTREEFLGYHMPQNIQKRYYRQHGNILAAYFGVLEKSECQKILKKVIEEKDLGEVQPYFAHFLLEAIYRNDLRDEYTLRVLESWKKPIEECPKGLPEGFYPPTPDYAFDRSHAWGGTPAYALPLALTGMEMVEVGFKEIIFSPSLLGLEYADVEIPTPYGMIEMTLEKGKTPIVSVPDGIKYTVK